MRACWTLPPLVLVWACSAAHAEPARAPAADAGAARAAGSRSEALDKAREHLSKSRYTAAEAAFRSVRAGKERGPALLGLSEVLLTTGRYDEALRVSDQAAAAGKAQAAEAAA